MDDCGVLFLMGAAIAWYVVFSLHEWAEHSRVARVVGAAMAWGAALWVAVTVALVAWTWGWR